MNVLLSKVPLGRNKKIDFPVLLWFALAFIAVLLETTRENSINNYIIFKQVFWHLIEQKNLYLPYPAEYGDMNHYGPSFALLIAPFAILPDWLGVILWSLANAAVLFIAIKLLPISRKNFLIVLLISAVEMMTATHSVQYNPMVAALIILAFVFVEKGNDFWGTFFIVFGFITKLYGIAAITFFLFSKHKIKFILYFAMWMVVLVCLPMIISSPAYIIQCYSDWYHSISNKILQNTGSLSPNHMQDICVMGMVRRILHTTNFSDLVILGPAVVLFGLPLLRISQYKSVLYRLRYLALVLIAIVIFSDSAESSTYVIPVVGVAIWYILQEKKLPWVIAMLVFMLLFTTLSATDLCPEYLKYHFIRAYALKALPCFIVWLILIAEVSFKKFDPLITEVQ
jgi:hypothetical protein